MKFLMMFFRWLISFFQYSGKLNSGIKTCNVILKIFNNQNSRVHCDVLKRRGFLYYLKGDVDQFLLDVNLSLQLSKTNKYRLEEGRCYGVLSIYYQEKLGNLLKALEYCQMSIDIQKGLAPKGSLVKLYIGKGIIFRKIGKFDDALETFSEALKMTRDKRLKINCYLESGRTYFARIRTKEARQSLLYALKILRRTNFANEKGDCYRELARIAIFKGNINYAAVYYQIAIAIYKKHGFNSKAKELEEERQKRIS